MFLREKRIHQSQISKLRISELLSSDLNNQTDLAKELGVSQKSISNYANCTSSPNALVLCRMADYFNVTLDYLCGRELGVEFGIIPKEKRETIITLLKLDSLNYISAHKHITSLYNQQEEDKTNS